MFRGLITYELLVRCYGLLVFVVFKVLGDLVSLVSFVFGWLCSDCCVCVCGLICF